jgi:hypothetical protein
VGFDLEATAGKVNPRRRLDIGSDDAKDGGREARSAISPDEWGLVEEAAFLVSAGRLSSHENRKRVKARMDRPAVRRGTPFNLIQTNRPSCSVPKLNGW